VTNKKTEKVMASRKSSIPVDAHSKQQNIIPLQPKGLNHASWVTKTESPWSQVPRPRPRSRPRLVKTGLELSRDQDSSLENSKSVLYP